MSCPLKLTELLRLWFGSYVVRACVTHISEFRTYWGCLLLGAYQWRRVTAPADPAMREGAMLDQYYGIIFSLKISQSIIFVRT